MGSFKGVRGDIIEAGLECGCPSGIRGEYPRTRSSRARRSSPSQPQHISAKQKPARCTAELTAPPGFPENELSDFRPFPEIEAQGIRCPERVLISLACVMVGVGLLPMSFFYLHLDPLA